MHTHTHKHNSINCVQTINIFPVPTCLLVKLFAVYWIGLVRSWVYISVYIVLHNVCFLRALSSSSSWSSSYLSCIWIHGD